MQGQPLLDPSPGNNPHLHNPNSPQLERQKAPSIAVDSIEVMDLRFPLTDHDEVDFPLIFITQVPQLKITQPHVDPSLQQP